MSNIKYTNDGKKVIIVGTLNAQETIVQEIFISGGCEVPSGENFVVKSLHDSPAVSWKEKNLKDLEARYNKERKLWVDQIEQQRRELKKAHDKAKLRAEALFNFDKNATHEALETAIKFLSGEITHVYFGGYSPSIRTIDDDYFFTKGSWSDKSIENLKIITLFGKTNGDVSFRLGQYSDGSGGSFEIKLATSYEEALGFAQEELNKECETWIKTGRGGLSFDYWEKIEGIVIPLDAQRKRDSIKNQQRMDKIEKLRKELEELENE